MNIFSLQRFEPTKRVLYSCQIKFFEKSCYFLRPSSEILLDRDSLIVRKFGSEYFQSFRYHRFGAYSASDFLFYEDLKFYKKRQ